MVYANFWKTVVLFVVSGSAAHSATVTPVNHGGWNTATSTSTVYFPIQGTGVCASPSLYPTTLSAIASSGGVLKFTVSPSKTLSEINGGSAPTVSDISIRAQLYGDPTTYVALVPPDGLSYNGSPSDATQAQYGTADGATVSFSIAMSDTGGKSGYCSTVAAETTGTCNPSVGQAAQTLRLRIGIVKTGNDFDTDANSDYQDFNIVTATCPPGLNSGLTSIITPSLDFTLTGGDEMFRVKNNGSAPSDVVPAKSVLVLADDTRQSPTIDAPVKRVHSGLTAGSEYEVAGLANDHTYCVTLAYVNYAGFVSVVPGMIKCVTPSKVEGFLQRSSCFIASAAYGEEFSTELEVYRQFRDQILARLPGGTYLIQGYYRWSPPLARWLFRHPWARRAVRGGLDVGLVGIRAILNFRWLAGRASFLNLFERAHAQAPQDEVAIKDKGEAKDIVSAPREGSPEVVTPAKSSAASLDPQVVQPYIESLKAGRKLEPNIRKKVNKAAGVGLVTVSQYNIHSRKVQANSFREVYKSDGKYFPALDLFHEWQLLRHPVIGTFGPNIHGGILSAKGKGIFTKSGVTSTEIKYQFLAFPVSAGPAYRFILGRFLVPYAQISGFFVPMLEKRSDRGSFLRSYSVGWTARFGGALSLDWIGRRNAWDLYDAYGILHTYLYLEKQFYRGLSGPVFFDYDGLFAGLAFEF